MKATLEISYRKQTALIINVHTSSSRIQIQGHLDLIEEWGSNEFPELINIINNNGDMPEDCKMTVTFLQAINNKDSRKSTLTSNIKETPVKNLQERNHSPCLKNTWQH